MGRPNEYDDLEEMQVPKKYEDDLEDDIKVGPSQKTTSPKNGKADKNPAAKAAKKSSGKVVGAAVAGAAAGSVATIVVIVVSVIVVIGALVGIGIWMGARSGNTGGTTTPSQSYSETVQKAEPDVSKTAFLNEGNLPEFSAEGVKGMLKEVYYTVDGDLAVTLNLSNGTASEHKLVRVGIRIFNGAQETVAQQTIDTFVPECVIPSMGRGEVYFVIDRENVILRNDPLSELGTTLEIGSMATDGSTMPAAESDEPVVGDGPKDIANGRTFYENTGNIPALSAEGVKASIIRARYTNDGSLAITLSVSNGTDVKQQVTKLDFLLQNGETGTTIAEYTFDTFETPCQVNAKGYAEMHLIVDTAYVSVKDDALSTLSCTISVGAGPVE